VWCASEFGWRCAMFVPAILSITMGIILINRLRDVPRTLGLPTVEEYKGQQTAQSAESKHDFLTIKEILFKQVLNNKFVWIFSLSYFFVYIVRTAVNDWAFIYLTEMKNMPAMLASTGVFWFEMGGVLGMIATGWGSDYFSKGNRAPATIICSLGLVFSIFGLQYIPPNHTFLDMLLLSMIGVFVFGPQMIVGLAAAEFVDKRAAATSNGFAGTWGYLGAAVTGYPLGKIIDVWGWSGFFTAILISAAAVFVMLLPMWSSSGENDREREIEWTSKPRLEKV
jgi:OPA family sugar phosphate sensor protein UhpC-like MFS transporter